MAKKTSKLFKRAIKKDIKMARNRSKHLSKQLFGKKCLTISHSFYNTTSLFRANESKPIYTVNRSGSCKISVLKMIIVTLCVISGAVLLGLAIKAIIDRVTQKPEDEYTDCELEYVDADELPF